MDYIGLGILIAELLLSGFLVYRSLRARRLWVKLAGGIPAALLALLFGAATASLQRLRPLSWLSWHIQAVATRRRYVAGPRNRFRRLFSACEKILPMRAGVGDTDDGRVVQVDPSTDQVVGELKVDTAHDISRYCQGLGTDGTNLWACSAGDETIDVVRIDPDTRTIVATVKVAKIFDQFDLPYLANRVWVLSGNANALIGIDIATNQPEPAINLGVRCFQLAATDNTLVATCARDNLVLKIDPMTGQITGRATLDEPGMIAAAHNAVWVGTSKGIARLDPTDLSLVAMFGGIGVGSAGDLYATEEAVWARQQVGFLYELDPLSNTIKRQIVADRQLSGGSVVVTADSIWTTASDDHVLLRLKR